MHIAKWIPRNDEWFDFFECSNCGKRIKEEVEVCPNCKAEMVNNSMEIVYNPTTQKWEKKKEPYTILEIATEEDYKKLCEMIEFWNEHHKENK